MTLRDIKKKLDGLSNADLDKEAIAVDLNGEAAPITGFKAMGDFDGPVPEGDSIFLLGQLI